MRKDVPVSWGRLSHPADLFASMQRQLDSLFDRDFERGWPLARLASSGAALAPSVDVKADAEKIVVKADLPGLAEKDVEVTLHDNALVLRGERRSEHEEDDPKAAWHAREIVYGAFSRTIPLDFDIDADKVVAAFDKGVLTVTLPKSAKAKDSERKIEVKSA